MKISTRWLKEYFPSNVKPEELARRLTLGAAEVESVTPVAEHLHHVKVGEVLSVSDHPDADQLHVVKVGLGGKTPTAIVCGASNVREGQKVAVALPGTTLPSEEGNWTIEARTIRGVVSHGMICSEKELGLGLDHDGILELTPKAKIGATLAEVLGLNDTILEIENKSITHRGDLWSHIGIARECGVLFGKPISVPVPPSVHGAHHRRLVVEVGDAAACPRYLGVLMDHIKMGPSPRWMQDRLTGVGIRPINVVVDITNYVMMEWGQPLHAFDAQRCDASEKGAKKVVVRRAKRGEQLTTLDGVKRKTDPTMLVIADEHHPIAFAGVMGGEHSAIHEKTSSLILEAAFFDPITIRQSAQQLGLRTEASQRFEKKLSPVVTEYAFRRAVALLTGLAGGRVASEVVDVTTKPLKKQMAQPASLRMNTETFEQQLGFSLSKSRIVSILRALEFEVKDGSSSSLTVTPPHFRPDVRLSEDVIEEVARVIGYENIEPKPLLGLLEPVRRSSEHEIEKRVSEVLVGAGFNEIYSYSFYGEDVLKKSGFKKSDHFELTNALSQDLKYLRTHMAPKMLAALKFNQKRFSQQWLFENGRVYCGEEASRIAGVMMGVADPFLRLKGAIEQCFRHLDVSWEEKVVTKSEASEQDASLFDAQTILSCWAQGEEIGRMAMLHNDTRQRFGLKSDVAYAELHTQALARVWKPAYRIAGIPIFPSVLLDIAIVVPAEVRWQEVEAVIRKHATSLRRLELFDVFIGPQIGEGKKSLAIHLEFNHPKKTFDQKEADVIQQKIITSLKRRFGAVLRS